MSASDFSICPHNVPCARQPLAPAAGAQPNLVFLSGDADPLGVGNSGRRFWAIHPPLIAQRLDSLMRRFREEGHNVTYADLQALRGEQ